MTINIIIITILRHGLWFFLCGKILVKIMWWFFLCGKKEETEVRFCECIVSVRKSKIEFPATPNLVRSRNKNGLLLSQILIWVCFQIERSLIVLANNPFLFYNSESFFIQISITKLHRKNCITLANFFSKFPKVQKISIVSKKKFIWFHNKRNNCQHDRNQCDL